MISINFPHPPQDQIDELITLYNNSRFFEASAKADKLTKSYNTSFVLWNIFGVTLQAQGKLDEAIAAYQRAITLKPDHVDAYNNMANVLQAQGKLDEAIAAYRYAITLKPDHAAAEAQLLLQRRYICDFIEIETLDFASSHLGIHTQAVPPFSALTWSDNSEYNLLRAQNWSKSMYKNYQLPLPIRHITRSYPIKVGYFSSDFYDHATMYLISGLFHNNNSDKFEIFAYSYGRNNTGIWHDRAKQYVNHFFDVSDKSDRCLAAR